MIDSTEIVVVPIRELEQIIRRMISEAFNKHYVQEHDEQVPNRDANKVFLTREEVSELLNVSYVTLNNWSKQGILEKRKIGTRVRYHIDDINQALKYKNSLNESNTSR